MIYLSDPLSPHLCLYIQRNQECRDTPKVFQTTCTEIFSPEFCVPQTSVTVLYWQQQKGTPPPTLGSHLRGKHHSFSTSYYIIYSKAFKKYLFLGVNKVAIGPSPLDNWFDIGICLPRLDSEFFSFQDETVFIHTWGSPSVDKAC